MINSRKLYKYSFIVFAGFIMGIALAIAIVTGVFIILYGDFEEAVFSTNCNATLVVMAATSPTGYGVLAVENAYIAMVILLHYSTKLAPKFEPVIGKILLKILILIIIYALLTISKICLYLMGFFYYIVGISKSMLWFEVIKWSMVLAGVVLGIHIASMRGLYVHAKHEVKQ